MWRRHALGASGRGLPSRLQQIFTQTDSAWGQAHPGWERPLQTQWRPLPTDHTLRFQRLPVGRVSDLKWKEFLGFPPAPNRSIQGSESLGAVAFCDSGREWTGHCGLGASQSEALVSRIVCLRVIQSGLSVTFPTARRPTAS